MAYFRTRPSELWPLETRRPRGARRQILSYAPRLGWLEARTLLAGTFVPDLTAEAVPLALGSPLTETIAPLETTYYRISSDTGGKLMVMLQASGFAARVSIVDPQGHPLVQSDGPAPGGGNDLIDLHVAAGDDFVEVQSLGGGGSYQITALLTPSQPPFQTVSSEFPPATLRSPSVTSMAMGSLTWSLLMVSTWALATEHSATWYRGARLRRTAGVRRPSR